jgi:hypothetical protein
MLDSGELLVATIDKVATPAAIAMTATSTQKSNADALTDSPSLDTSPDHVDHTHSLMPRHARPHDRKHTLYRSRIRMTDTASLHTYADIAGFRIDQRFPSQFEFAAADRMNGLVVASALVIVLSSPLIVSTHRRGRVAFT